jgi:hypothetical protein
MYDDADIEIVDILPIMYTTRDEAARAAVTANIFAGSTCYRLFPLTSAEIAWFVARGGSGGRVFVRQIVGEAATPAPAATPTVTVAAAEPPQARKRQTATSVTVDKLLYGHRTR